MQDRYSSTHLKNSQPVNPISSSDERHAIFIALRTNTDNKHTLPCVCDVMSYLFMPEAVLCLLPMTKPISHHLTLPSLHLGKIFNPLLIGVVLPPSNTYTFLSKTVHGQGILRGQGVLHWRCLEDTDALYFVPHTRSTDIMFGHFDNFVLVNLYTRSLKENVWRNLLLLTKVWEKYLNPPPPPTVSIFCFVCIGKCKEL